MLNKIWKYIAAILAISGGVLALLLNIKSRQAEQLKAEAAGAKATAVTISEQLERTEQAVEDAESERDKVVATEATMDSIKAETVKQVQEAQQIAKDHDKVPDVVTFGKWVLVFCIMFYGAGCAPKINYETCRSTYPCPRNVCINTTPPHIETLPRPQLTELAVSYDKTLDGYLLTKAQIAALMTNERALIETVNGYEKIIQTYSSWRDQTVKKPVQDK